MQGGKDLVGGYRIIFRVGSWEDPDSKEMAEEVEEEEEAIAREGKIGVDMVANG
jgi:hypothetical protein